MDVAQAYQYFEAAEETEPSFLISLYHIKVDHIILDESQWLSVDIFRSKTNRTRKVWQEMP